MLRLFTAGTVALALSASFASAATYVFDYTQNGNNIDVTGYGSVDMSDLTYKSSGSWDRYLAYSNQLGFRGTGDVRHYYTELGFSGYSGSVLVNQDKTFSGQAMAFAITSTSNGGKAEISLDADYVSGEEMSLSGVILSKTIDKLKMNFDDVITFGANRIVFSRNGVFSDAVLAALPELGPDAQVSAVPLPGSLALMASGLAVAGFAFRSKKRKA